MSTQIYVILGGSILLVYALAVVAVLLVPPRQADPHRGQAVGCLMIVVIALLGVGGLLALAYAMDWRWLVMGIFYLTVYPAIMLVAMGVVTLYRRVTKS